MSKVDREELIKTINWGIMTCEQNLCFGLDELNGIKHREKRLIGILNEVKKYLEELEEDN